MRGFERKKRGFERKMKGFERKMRGFEIEMNSFVDGSVRDTSGADPSKTCFTFWEIERRWFSLK